MHKDHSSAQDAPPTARTTQKQSTRAPSSQLDAPPDEGRAGDVASPSLSEPTDRAELAPATADQDNGTTELDLLTRIYALVFEACAGYAEAVMLCRALPARRVEQLQPRLMKGFQHAQTVGAELNALLNFCIASVSAGGSPALIERVHLPFLQPSPLDGEDEPCRKAAGATAEARACSGCTDATDTDSGADAGGGDRTEAQDHPAGAAEAERAAQSSEARPVAVAARCWNCARRVPPEHTDACYHCHAPHPGAGNPLLTRKAVKCEA